MFIIAIGENTVEAEFIRVPCDVEAMAAAIEAAGLPHEFATVLRKASG